MIPRYTPDDLRFLTDDQSKFGEWLRVELAVVFVREALGGFPSGTHWRLSERARFMVEEVHERDKEIEHDLQAFVDVVRRYLNELASYFHDEVTSFDVVDTAQALLLQRAGERILARIERFLLALKDLAERHALTLRVGRTHGVHAEPVTFGFEVLNWYDQVRLARDLVQAGFQAVSVGKLSGAVGTYTLNPEIERLVCEQLGLERPVITTQITSRVVHAQLMSALAILVSVLDKISQDIRISQITEVGELEEPRKAAQKGSSAMAHKKNPVLCERVTGLARVGRHNAGVGFDNIVTWFERDIAQSSAERVALIDLIILTAYELDRMAGLIEGLIVKAGRMRRNMELSGGAIYSQDIKTFVMTRVREWGASIDPESVYRCIQESAFRSMDGEGSFVENLFANTTVALGNLVSEEEIRALMNPWRKLRHLPIVFQRFGITMKLPESAEE